MIGLFQEEQRSQYSPKVEFGHPFTFPASSRLITTKVEKLASGYDVVHLSISWNGFSLPFLLPGTIAFPECIKVLPW